MPENFKCIDFLYMLWSYSLVKLEQILFELDSQSIGFASSDTLLTSSCLCLTLRY